jgi:hypothetical protein
MFLGRFQHWYLKLQQVVLLVRNSDMQCNRPRCADDNLNDDITLLDIGHFNQEVEMSDLDWASDEVEMEGLDWYSDSTSQATYNVRNLRPRLRVCSDPESIEEAQDSTNFFVFSDDVLKLVDVFSPSGFLIKSPSGFFMKTAPPSPSLLSWDSTAAYTPPEKPNRPDPTTSSSGLGRQTSWAVDTSKPIYVKETALYDKEARLAHRSCVAEAQPEDKSGGPRFYSLSKPTRQLTLIPAEHL